MTWDHSQKMTRGVYDSDDDTFVDVAEGLRETGGPTTLTAGIVADGAVVTRSGTTYAGVARAGIDTDATTHAGSTANPHSVTAAQAAADPAGSAAAAQAAAEATAAADATAKDGAHLGAFAHGDIATLAGSGAQAVGTGDSPTLDGTNFTGLSSALTDFIATDFAASHDFTDGVAYNGWTLSGYHANDTWASDGAGNLNIACDGADSLAEREFIKTVTLPAPPTALTGISWNADIDFTYGAGTSVGTANSRTTWLLRSIDLAEYVYFQWRYDGANESKFVVRNLGTDGGDASAAVNMNWAADAAERMTIWWSPNGCGCIANNAGVSDADTWDFAVRKAWTETSATLKLQILVDPDNAADNVNMQISRMTLAY